MSAVVLKCANCSHPLVRFTFYLLDVLPSLAVDLSKFNYKSIISPFESLHYHFDNQITKSPRVSTVEGSGGITLYGTLADRNASCRRCNLD